MHIRADTCTYMHTLHSIISTPPCLARGGPFDLSRGSPGGQLFLGHFLLLSRGRALDELNGTPRGVRLGPRLPACTTDRIRRSLASTPGPPPYIHPSPCPSSTPSLSPPEPPHPAHPPPPTPVTPHAHSPALSPPRPERLESLDSVNVCSFKGLIS